MHGWGRDDFDDTWAGTGNDTTKFAMQYGDDARQFTYFFRNNADQRQGFSPFAHTLSQDIKGYERGTGPGSWPYHADNWWGAANTMLNFFISGPTEGVVPTYAGTDDAQENFFTTT